MKAQTAAEQSPNSARRHGAKFIGALCLALLAAGALAQPAGRPNGALLVAKPDLTDPNFARTVVLVTQADSGETVGVVLNRPSERKHPRTGEVIYSGGPVLREVLVAVFRSAEPPAAPAFHALRGVYLSMHPANLEHLLSGDAGNHRLYSGFAGWAPGQLESEMQSDGWYVLPASEELLFRADTAGMWEELAEKARGSRTDSRNIPRYGTAKNNAPPFGSGETRIHF
jgi:putative transcriptional regulator